MRAHYGTADSRVEKEMYSLSKEHTVKLLGWDRSKSYDGVVESSVQINDKTFCFMHIGIRAPLGEGLKKMLPLLPKFWLRVWKYLKSHMDEYDVIHFCDLDAAVPLLFIRKWPLVVYDIFDYYADAHYAPPLMRKMIKAAEGRIIRKSDVVIICSEARRKQILPGVPEKLIVIHNSPSEDTRPAELKLAEGSDPEKCRIVYAGMLIDGRFLREMGQVIAEKKGIELHIGGIGPLSDFFSTLAQEKSNIFFYGPMSYSEILGLERNCDVMTAVYDPRIPNHQYAAPNKFYESLLQMKPLIMVKNTGMDDYVSNNRLGVVIDIDERGFAECFSVALDEIIHEKDQWPEMGRRGLELYKKQFSWKMMEKRLLSVYKELEEQHAGQT